MMSDRPSPQTDPDRFFDRTTPGAHEWWYFDAISDDGRDALVIVWYAGLPFDPSYGVATLRHLRDPGRYPQPLALDHAAIGFSWYRDGKTIAYALNGHRAHAFRQQAGPFAVEVATSRVDRDGSGYRLDVATPSVAGRPILAKLRFHPADATEPFERDLGTPGAPHNWLLAAADCRVEGTVEVDGEPLEFAGRGYHDHNAGAEEMSVAMKRWEWGRVHREGFTHVFYHSEPRRGGTSTLWLACRDGKPEVVREGGALAVEAMGVPRRNVFGVRHDSRLKISEGRAHIDRSTGGKLRIQMGGSKFQIPSGARLVDDGPFYQRWLAEFAIFDGSGDHYLCTIAPGFAELLDTRNLNRRWFNWMIPYRLKWPDFPK